MDETNWDNFELRNFNHDLGRWSAPDPYAQFHSPYLAMANNPVNNIDPNGGYMVASDEGMVQRGKFVQKWQEYIVSEKGQQFIRANYLRDYDELAKKYLRYADDLNQKSGGEFLKALLRLNNDYLGMGLSGIYLASGSDRLTSAAMLKNKNLLHTLQEMNGEAQRVEDAQKVVDDYHRPLNNIDAAEQEFMNNNARRQRAYVDKWRAAVANAARIHVFGVGGKSKLGASIKDVVETIFAKNGIRTRVIFETGKAEGTKPIGNDFYANVQETGSGDFSGSSGFSDIEIQAGIEGGIGINLGNSFISTDNLSAELKASNNTNITFEYAVAYAVAHEVAHQMAAVGSFISVGGMNSDSYSRQYITGGGLDGNFHSGGLGLNSSSDVFFKNANLNSSQRPWEIIQWDLKKSYINPWLNSLYK